MTSNHDSDVDEKNNDSDQTNYPISNIFTVFKMCRYEDYYSVIQNKKMLFFIALQDWKRYWVSIKHPVVVENYSVSMNSGDTKAGPRVCS